MRAIDGDVLYDMMQKDEELARKRVLDTKSTLPYPTNLNPSYARYLAQMDERTRLKHMIADAPTIDLPRWIPVTERLPENDDKVLCCTVTTKGIRNIVIGYYMERWCCGMNSNVIAWMPLPEPFKEDTDEGNL